MSAFPQQGGSKDTWGTELRAFFSPFFDLVTGNMVPNSVDGNIIKDNSLTSTQVNTAYKDGDASIPSMRTLGTGSQQACAGDDIRLTANGSITALPTVDFTFVGPYTSLFQVDETVLAGSTVVMDISGGWINTGANAEETSSGMMAMSMTVSGFFGDNIDVALPGSFIKNSAWNWTIGDDLYLSETSGMITQTQPTTANCIIRKIGYAVTPSVIYFNPSPDWITHI